MLLRRGSGRYTNTCHSAIIAHEEMCIYQYAFRAEYVCCRLLLIARVAREWKESEQVYRYSEVACIHMCPLQC